MPIHGYPGGVITANPVAPTSTVATGVWTTEQQLQATSAGNWPRPGPPQPISRSLRFNSADSTYLNRTPASTGNQTAWTWSAWVKRSTIETSRENVYAINNSNRISFSNDDSSQNLVFEVYNGSGADYFMQTAAVYRDPSAWYHIVAVWDSNNGTSADRQRLYVNGVRITAFAASGNSIPSGATSNNWNTTSANNIGRSPVTANYFSGYLTELYFIDGQALTPSSFGQTNASTGVWEPIPYTGTYGTNGFYLNFSDNSGTTSTTLGADTSGNGNNWTPNNFSVTAGAGNDSLVDSPTSYGTDTGIGGSVRGNYVTWNALDRNSSGTLANGNLDWTSGTTAHYGVRGTMSPPSGKWYFEVTAAAATSGTIAYGIGMANAANPLNVGAQSNTGAYLLYGVGTSLELEAAGVQGSTITGASISANDVIQVAYDVDGSKMWVGKNNTWYNSSGGTTGNPSAGTNPSFSSLLANLFPFVEVYNNTVYANFGQRAFAYTAPSGFKALCTQNLPTPTIGATSTTQANDYFDATTYTGNGTSQSVVNAGGFQPDFVWVKDRTSALNHILANNVAGITNFLNSNTTSAESNTAGVITAVNSNGFSVGSIANVNTNTNAYVAWQWRANGAGSTNTAGTITSTVSANTTSGFSIVTYTGTGANATVGHGLGVAPSFITIKQRNGTWSWMTYHVSLPTNAYVLLNDTAAQATSRPDVYNGAPSSTVINIGNNATINGSGSTYVAYCFAPVAGYSAFGSYTGNGSTDGPFVYTGFRPRYLLLKVSSTTSSWFVYDSARDTYNIVSYSLNPNLSDAEGNTGVLDFVSNGFKLRNSGASFNVNGNTVIYAAFAESPFKYSLAR